MNSMDGGLTKDEMDVFFTKCHWAILLGPILVMTMGGLAVESQGIHAFALVAFGLVWCVFSYFTLNGLKITLTEKRVLISTGFPGSKVYDIPLNAIVTIDFYQPALGSILGFGKIWVVYRGQSRCTFRFISSPALFVTEVRQRLSSPARP